MNKTEAPTQHDDIRAGLGRMAPRLAIVTVTYNSADVLPEFLASLDSQTDRSWLLIAIDNASSDSSVEQLAGWDDDRLLLIRNDGNFGFAKATNQGLRIAVDAGIEWVLILNNDVGFGPDALALLMERASRGDAEVYAPHIVYHSRPTVTWFGGGAFSNAWGFRATLEGDGKADWAKAGHERWVDFAPGCCKLVSSRRLAVSGFYDEDYFVYWEDVDLCWRWKEAGVKVRYLPAPVIRHKVSALTGGESSAFSLRMYHMNQAIFLRKNFGSLAVAVRVLAIVFKIALRLASGRDGPGPARARIGALVAGLRSALTATSTSTAARSPAAGNGVTR